MLTTTAHQYQLDYHRMLIALKRAKNGDWDDANRLLVLASLGKRDEGESLLGSVSANLQAPGADVRLHIQLGRRRALVTAVEFFPDDVKVIEFVHENHMLVQRGYGIAQVPLMASEASRHLRMFAVDWDSDHLQAQLAADRVCGVGFRVWGVPLEPA